MPFVPLTEDKWDRKPCHCREHNPPSHIVLPPGIHKWICPVCGESQIVYVPEVTLEKAKRTYGPFNKADMKYDYNEEKLSALGAFSRYTAAD